MRERWSKIKRAEGAREATTEALAVVLGEGQCLPDAGPWFVRITRISSGTLDDDNLRRAMKHVRDTIAAALRVDDGSPLIAWDYRQVKERGFLGAIVEVWSAL